MNNKKKFDLKKILKVYNKISNDDWSKDYFCFCSIFDINVKSNKV